MSHNADSLLFLASWAVAHNIRRAEDIVELPLPNKVIGQVKHARDIMETLYDPRTLQPLTYFVVMAKTYDFGPLRIPRNLYRRWLREKRSFYFTMFPYNADSLLLLSAWTVARNMRRTEDVVELPLPKKVICQIKEARDIVEILYNTSTLEPLSYLGVMMRMRDIDPVQVPDNFFIRWLREKREKENYDSSSSSTNFEDSDDDDDAIIARDVEQAFNRYMSAIFNIYSVLGANPTASSSSSSSSSSDDDDDDFVRASMKGL
ncbi:hypothetical protein U1Q18_047038 [Sarracenia purpurea var. burkii]